MELVALGLGGLFAAATVVFVAVPFLRQSTGAVASAPEASERRRLLERRGRALAALKELEFDHRTGKISDADYAQLVPALRRDAAEVLRLLEPQKPQELLRAPVRRRRRKRPAAASLRARRAG